MINSKTIFVYNFYSEFLECRSEKNGINSTNERKKNEKRTEEKNIWLLQNKQKILLLIFFFYFSFVL